MGTDAVLMGVDRCRSKGGGQKPRQKETQMGEERTFCDVCTQCKKHRKVACTNMMIREGQGEQ